ncbi:MAG: hypothetical protein GWN58_54595 [Anaerolineae bacterium]|nr:hypothetical protein [Anaerolineae bacterium]
MSNRKVSLKTAPRTGKHDFAEMMAEILRRYGENRQKPIISAIRRINQEGMRDD